jgi:type I restriction enzyme, S subunit
MENKKITIPDGWQEAMLGDVCDVLSKKEGVLKTEYKDFGLYAIYDQGQSYISGYVDDIKYIYDDFPLVLFGDHSCIVKYINNRYAVGNDGMKLLKSKENIDPLFFYYLILSQEIVQTGYNRHFKYLKEKSFLLPKNKKEQQKIVSILMKVDEEIEKLEEIISKSEEMKKGLMQHLFSRGIGHKKFKDSEFGKIPEGWEVRKLGDLVLNNILEKPLDGNHGNLHPKGKDFVSSGVPFVMASNLKDGKVDLVNCSFITKKQANTLKKGFAKDGDVLLSHKATIGRTALVKTNLDYIILTPQVTYYRSKNKSKLFNVWLKYYFDSPDFQKILNSFAGGRSTRAYIGITNQLDLSILFPPLQEQKEIALILSAVYEKIDVNKKIKDKLVLLKKGLMGDLLSGRKRV